MRIVDNYLDPEVFLALSTAIMSPTFPWENCQILKDPPANFPPECNQQYVHGFYLQNAKRVYRSHHLGLIQPLVAHIGPRRLIKVKVNATKRQSKQVAYASHTDTQQPDATTAVLYLNTNNGYTLFEDGRKVESVANRMVFFDAALPHSGVHCTDADRRLVLNINMFLDNAPHRQ